MAVANTAIADLEQGVRGALNEILDPCSVGRGVPAGLLDMGMVCDLELEPCGAGQADVHMTLRLTSPGCTFQLFFERELCDRLGELNGVRNVDIVWSRQFDWSDDDMSPALKRRLREKRERVLSRSRGSAQRPSESIRRAIS